MKQTIGASVNTKMSTALAQLFLEVHVRSCWDEDKKQQKKPYSKMLCILSDESVWHMFMVTIEEQGPICMKLDKYVDVRMNVLCLEILLLV